MSELLLNEEPCPASEGVEAVSAPKKTKFNITPTDFPGMSEILRKAAEIVSGKAKRAAPSAPKLYFESSSGKFWIDINGKLIPHNETMTRLNLWTVGFSKDRENGPSEVDNILTDTIANHTLDWIGVLAGWPKGAFTYDDASLMNLRETKLWVPTYGSNTVVKDYFRNLLGEEQLPYLLAWIKLAIASVETGRKRILSGKYPRFRISQALSIVGGVGDGKTVCAMLLTKLIAGVNATAGNPAQAAQGGTSFNEDLSEKMVHVLDDEGGQVDYASRRKFGEAIKRSVATHEKRIHGKNKKPITLEPFCRTILLLNDELSDLQILPPLDGSLGDKFLILKTVGKGFREPGGDYETRLDTLIDGIPDFLGALSQWQIPAAIKDERYGVVSYHNPDVVQQVSELGGEEFIVSLLKELAKTPWAPKGPVTTGDIYSAFMTDPTLSKSLMAVARRPETLGKLLASIRKQYPKLAQLAGRPGHGPQRFTYDFSVL
jgi:Family of unknown function (DUF5906)